MLHDHQAKRIRQLERAWAEQIRDLAPRIGLRALAGVPDEVKALLADPPAVDPSPGQP